MFGKIGGTTRRRKSKNKVENTFFSCENIAQLYFALIL